MKCRRTPKRIKRFLARVGLTDDVAAALRDPRKPNGRRWSFRVLVEVLVTGAVLQAPALTAVEDLSARAGPRVPDSTLAYTLERLDPRPLRAVLRQQVRAQLRS